MITQLLTVLFNWLATHLVAITLLGFVVVGLDVSGTMDLLPKPGGEGTETAEAAKRPLAAGKAPEKDFPAAQGDLSHPSGPAAGKPRLIGGILPLRDVTGRDDGSFRPPGDIPPSADDVQPDYLQQARRAFWNGDFEASEAAYMTLISLNPGDGNAFGELGNLYQAMNRPERALDAYFEAGVRFRVAGESEKLNEIIEVLRQQEDKRAQELIP